MWLEHVARPRSVCRRVFFSSAATHEAPHRDKLRPTTYNHTRTYAPPSKESKTECCCDVSPDSIAAQVPQTSFYRGHFFTFTPLSAAFSSNRGQRRLVSVGRVVVRLASMHMNMNAPWATDFTSLYCNSFWLFCDAHFACEYVHPSIRLLYTHTHTQHIFFVVSRPY